MRGDWLWAAVLALGVGGCAKQARPKGARAPHGRAAAAAGVRLRAGVLARGRAKLAERLAEGATPQGAEADRISREWVSLAVEVQRLAKTGADPTGLEGQSRAQRRVALMSAFAQGDTQIEQGVERFAEQRRSRPAEGWPVPGIPRPEAGHGGRGLHTASRRGASPGFRRRVKAGEEARRAGAPLLIFYYWVPGGFMPPVPPGRIPPMPGGCIPPPAVPPPLPPGCAIFMPLIVL
jgi:hypothetical protein